MIDALTAFNKIRFNPRADTARVPLSTRPLRLFLPHLPFNAPTITSTVVDATVSHSRFRAHQTSQQPTLTMSGRGKGGKVSL